MKTKTNKQYKEYGDVCFNAGKQEGKAEAKLELEKLINADEVYPLDIFPALTNKELSEIHELMILHMGFPLDRLSAHIGRSILNGLKSKLREAKNEK